MNKIIHGDSMRLDWDAALGGRTIDLLMIDPPYNTTTLEFDGSFDVADMMKAMDTHLSHTAWIFMWGTVEMAAMLLPTYKRKFEYVWSKAITFSRPTTVRPLMAHETCYAFIRKDLERVGDLYFDKHALRLPGEPYKRHRDNVEQSEFRDNTNLMKDIHTDNWGYREGQTVLNGHVKKQMRRAERTEHPTQKPLAIYEPILRAYCPPKGLVVDPCAGSGTTHVAGINTKRNTICVEKNENYCAMISKRPIPKPHPVVQKPPEQRLDVFVI